MIVDNRSGNRRCDCAQSTGGHEPRTLCPRSDLLTVAASGLPGYEAGAMFGMWAPAGTPAPIISRPNQEIVRILSRPEVKERFLNTGIEVMGSSPREFAVAMKADTARLQKLIKAVGMKAD